METSIRGLIEAVLSELERLHYKNGTISQYRTAYKKYERFTLEQGTISHSVELGNRWLQEGCGIDIAIIEAGGPTRTEHKVRNSSTFIPVRAIQCLNEWMLFEQIPLKRQGKFARIALCPSFDTGMKVFGDYCREMGYSEPGTFTRLNRLKRMLIFFEAKGLSGLNDVTAVMIADFIKTQINFESRTVATVLSTIRCFFRVLYLQEIIGQDLSEKVPKLKANRNHRLPKVWKTEDVQALLATIDRDNPTGKRDYAILLMIARYGLRSADVRKLKLTSLDWEKKFLTLVQSKTGRIQTLPLLHDVGWAIADYLRYGRPKVDLEYVFLTHTVPYRPFSNTGGGIKHILVKRIRAAGIKVPRDVPRGMHALRHTLASALLSQNVSLPVISSVLGHATTEATAIYLHTDLIRLRDCVLDPEEVLHAIQQ